MRLIIDATALTIAPVGKPNDAPGATEAYLHRLAAGLAEKHTVHVVTPDLEQEEQRQDKLWYWGPRNHPTSSDAVIMFHNLANISPYSADQLILVSNGLGAFLGPDDEFVTGCDAIACLSQSHQKLLCRHHPKVDETKCFVTGLGVETSDYDQLGYYGILDPLKQGPRWHYEKVTSRLLYGNAPERGLLHMLKIFELVQKERFDATLHVTYGWEVNFEKQRWGASVLSEEMWECRRLIESNSAVKSCGILNRKQMIQEQLECQVYVYPCSPPNVGSQLHCVSALEAAACGTPLVLSNIEALPEVFGRAAVILPPPGAFVPNQERRCDYQDWAEIVVDLMKNKKTWQAGSIAARQLAEENSWEKVIAVWEEKLHALMSPVENVA